MLANFGTQSRYKHFCEHEHKKDNLVENLLPKEPQAKKRERDVYQKCCCVEARVRLEHLR